MSERSETPTTIKKNRQERNIGKIIKTITNHTIISIIVSTIVVSSIIMFLTFKYKDIIWDKVQHTQQYTILLKKLQKPKEYVPNPEIEVIAKYIKQKNQKLPSEVAAIIADKIVYFAESKNISTSIIIGIMWVESRFDPLATSNIPNEPDKHAKGLMQILRGENINIDPEQAYDISYNIEKGCDIFNKKYEISKKNLEKALFTYSGGKQGYPTDVLKEVGLYSLYSWQNIRNGKQEEIENISDIKISMIYKDK